MPLKVIIIGAGIGGLSAAAALSRAGHDVEIFEQSSFANEVGAAISLAPNATRILKYWDCDFRDLQPVECASLHTWSAHGDLMATQLNTLEIRKELGISDDWLLTHRVDLHNTLRTMALREINGRWPKLHLAAKVASVDASIGEICLHDGQVHRADLIIGADGVHSQSVTAVTKTLPQKVDSGQKCFRFLVPVERLTNAQHARTFVEQYGLDAINVFLAKGRKFVTYPCRGGRLLNVGAFYESRPEDVTAESSYLAAGAAEEVTEMYSSFCPAVQELCSLAEDVKKWSLATRDPPASFTAGKMALLGDAAHPTLPHQGQGGAQAMEDAAALGALFSQDIQPSDVPARLEMYEKVRYDRAVTVMMLSRVDNEERSSALSQLKKYVPKAELPKSMPQFLWTSDPVAQAQRLLSTVAT